MSAETAGTGIKTNLANITSLKAIYAPNQLPDTLYAFPCALIQHVGTNYDQAMGGLQEHIFKIKIAITSVDKPSSLNKLLDYTTNTGDDSVRAKIEDDVTLNSSVSTSWVVNNTGQGTFVWGGIPYLGTEFEIVAYE